MQYHRYDCNNEIVGSYGLIQRARRIRKAMGGGLRQAGFLAAAGLYALKHNISR
jgi:threonine aldolase